MRKPFCCTIAILTGIFATVLSTFAQGNAFTYQGRLNTGATPANGIYDLAFTLYNDPTAGASVSSTVTNSATAVSNGLFTVTLDFGTGIFNGTKLWLGIDVRTNGPGAFTGLVPRQPITPAPYAIFANTTSNLTGTLAAAQLSGTVPLAQLPVSIVTNNATGLTLTGSFTGNGSGLSNVSSSFAAATITNTSTNPVPVIDVQSPINQTFATNLTMNIANGTSGDAGNGTPRFFVPTNKVLVIECVSGYLSGTAASTVQHQCFLNTIGSINGGFNAFGFNFPAPVAGLQFPGTFTQSLKAYAMPGTGVIMNCFRSSTTGPITFVITISGYYVNYP
ncbi:MAG: hypothetical protein JWQ71_1515 [Pedosphaera sp.]|nr:hypothetical protein [Pedosphaera sp.]